MRLGILDIVAAGALFVALVLPGPSRPIKNLYSREAATLAPAIALAQAEVARDPASGTSAARLSELLVRARQTDWAVRAAVRAATGKAADRWRAIVALSAAHLDRFEVGDAVQWAVRAVEACDAEGSDCTEADRVRLELYNVALRAVFDSHIDPKVNRKGFVEAAERAVPLIRLGKGD